MLAMRMQPTAMVGTERPLLPKGKEIESIQKNGNRDYKTLLQQFVEKNGDALLRYDIEENGPEHEKTFIATAYINNNKVGDGKGSTKRTAEMQAAKVALRLFGIL